jgi:hypothetical protein
MKEDVQKVLRRVLVDDDFLDQMLTSPGQALQEYDLTDEERAVLESRDRDLVELMRLGGEGNQFTLLFLDITLVIDLTEFITTLHLDITIDLATAQAQRRQEQNRQRIEALAQSVRSMRAGADRLERIQEMLQTMSGATELAARRAADPGQNSGTPE